MKSTRIVCVALVALMTYAVSMSANAATMRAFWAGTVTEAVAGNALALAVGDVVFAETFFDSANLQSFSNSVFAGGVEVDAIVYASQPALGDAETFTGQIRYLASMTWQAIDNGEVVASGTWSEENIKFDSTAVIPVPAALPLLIGGLGLLAGFRRRARI